MSVTPTYVLDASVALKWMFEDEAHIVEARSVLADYQAGAIELVSPDHLIHEVLNGLRNGVLKQRITEADAIESMYDFLSLHIRSVGGSARNITGLYTALDLNCAYYDALYVALANESRIQLIYADGKLRNSLFGRFEHGLWIEDYVSPSTSQVPSDN